MAVDQSQLKEPIVNDDMLDHEEMVEGIAETVKALFDRARFHWGDSPFSNDLWIVYGYLHAAAEKMSQIRAGYTFPE